MTKTNAKKQTQGTRPIQRVDISQRHIGGSEGVDEYSNRIRYKSIGAAGKDWSEGNTTQDVWQRTTKKILDRLIDSWKDRRREAEDCLNWHNSLLSKCNDEIEILELMKAELEANTEEE
ncbi:MAG: hypothetical protein SWX82_33835 [Cyanobacteriota bacterium]|nr:hypothetical protein [Cyanobacteriota bacterium]